MLRYAKTNLKRVPLDLPKDEYERIAAHVKEHGYGSLNGWIKSAIAAKIELDNSPTTQEITKAEAAPADKPTSSPTLDDYGLTGNDMFFIMCQLTEDEKQLTAISQTDGIDLKTKQVAANNAKQVKAIVDAMMLNVKSLAPTSYPYNLSMITTTIEPPKRRRGRPRKNPPAE